MDKSEALRSIRYDLVEYIQQKVKVDFDNSTHAPTSFRFGGKSYMVEEVLGRFRTQRQCPQNAYLMQVGENKVFFLYFHFFDWDQSRFFHQGYWVLCFRILCDHEIMGLYREDRKVLLNMTLKRIVDFHGHLCPDLILGCKLCEYVQKLLPSKGQSTGSMSIIAENCTSALDAIQIMLGTTMGNQRLMVMDFGKHNYTVFSQNAKIGFKLSLKKQHYGDEETYQELEEKIKNEKIVVEDAVYFQKLMDGRIKCLLNRSPEEVFAAQPVKTIQPFSETLNIFKACGRCGEQVLESHLIDFEGDLYCAPCFQRLRPNQSYSRLH